MKHFSSSHFLAVSAVSALTWLIIAFAAVPIATAAGEHAVGFQWNRATDWVEGGRQPHPDRLGHPVWSYAYSEAGGGGVGRNDPWYEKPLRLIRVAEDGLWRESFEVGISRTDARVYAGDSNRTNPTVVWTNPTGAAVTLSIDGSVSFLQSGDDSASACLEFAIVQVEGETGKRNVLWSHNYTPHPADTDETSSLQQVEGMESVALGPRDQILFTSRAFANAYRDQSVRVQDENLTLTLRSLETPAQPEKEFTLFVCPINGNDEFSGWEREQPLRSLPAALARARGGDTILMLPGTHYFTSLTIRDIPHVSKERRLTIRAEVPGQTTLSQAWPAAARGEVEWRHEGDGLYSAPQWTLDGEPVPSSIGGYRDHILIAWSTLEELQNAECKYNPTHSGRLRWTTFKTPGYGMAHADGRTYLRLPERSDPNGKRVVIGYGHFSKTRAQPEAALLNIQEVDGLVIDGLRFEGAFLGMWLQSHGSGPDAGHNVVRNCQFEWTLRGINARSVSSTYEWNEYAFTGLRQLIDEIRDLNGRFGTPEIFSIGYAPTQLFGMFIYGDMGGTEIRYNYVNQAWDGLHFGNMPDARVHRNILEDCIDNAIEIEAGFWPVPTGHNVHFHHNLVLGLANGAISQTKGGPVTGPHYIYRNVFVGHDDPGWSSWVFAKSRSHGASQGLIYHHNLIWMRESGNLYWNPANEEHRAFIETMDWRNNVLMFDRLGQAEAIFPVHHNVMAGSAGEKPGLQGPGGFHVATFDELGFRDPENYDFTLTEGSPLIDAGQPIPGDFLGHVQDRAASVESREQFLADIQRYTVGAAPDIGPFEFGQEMGPDWPRPRRGVYNAAPLGEEPRLKDFERPEW